MAKCENMIIVGDDCKGCKYFKDNNNNKVTCEARNKTYYYGQYVPCENREEMEV